jgi:hypothetical protein
MGNGVVSSVTGHLLRSAAALALSLAASVSRADPPAVEAPAAERSVREPSGKERARARRLFEEAAELENAREWSLAAEKLSEALGIVETPGLRYHLAFCQEARSLMVEALANYDRAEQLIAAGNKAPDVVELLVPKRDALRLRVPKLRVSAQRPAAVERVAIDGILIARELVEQPIALNPGRHRVTVWAKDNPTPLEHEVTLSEGVTHTEQFAWPAAAPAARAAPAAVRPAEAAAPPRPERAGVSARTVVLIGEASLTAVALGLGVGFHLSANGAESDAETLRSRVPGNSACDPQLPTLPLACTELQQANQREKDHRLISQVALATAAAGAAATVVTWIFWKPASRDSTLGVSPTMTASAGGVELWGRF